MKKFRKIMAVLVAAIMVVAMTVPAFAASTSGRMQDDKGTITISADTYQSSQNYIAYKILDLASFSDTVGSTGVDQHAEDAYAYVIKTDSPWLPFVENAVLGKDAEDNDVKYFDVDKSGTVVIKKATNASTVDYSGEYYVVKPNALFANSLTDAHTADETIANEYTTGVNGLKPPVQGTNSAAQRLAQAAIYYAQNTPTNTVTEKGVAPVSSVPAETVATNSALIENVDNGHKFLPTTTATFANIPLGYYVVTSSTGTLCALDTTNKSVEVKDKNIPPAAVTKEVQEDSLASAEDAKHIASGLGDHNDADIGDTIYYKSVIDVKKGAEKYEFRDKMDGGLTFVPTSLKVYLLKANADESTYDADKWVLLDGTEKLLLSGNTEQTATEFPSGDVSLASFYDLDYKGNGGSSHNVTYTEAIVNPETAAVNGTFVVTFKQPFLTFLSDQMHEGRVDDPDTTDVTEPTDTPAGATHYRLVLTYEAILNKNAKLDSTTENKNMAKLVYGEKKTVASEITTYTSTWAMKIRKFTNVANDTTKEANGAGRTLDGAHFQIFNSDKTKTLRFIKEDEGVYRYDSRADIQTGTTITGWSTTDVDTIGEAANVNDLDESGAKVTVVDTLTTANGIILIKGLDGDSYFLRETLAPVGYYQKNGYMPFHIVSYNEKVTETVADMIYTKGTPNARVTDAGAVVIDDFNATVVDNVYKTRAEEVPNQATTPTNENKQIGIENETSTELPSTGGMGTTVLYIVGGMLVILAGAYLFFSRKRTA